MSNIPSPLRPALPKHLSHLEETRAPLATGHHGFDTPTAMEQRDPLELMDLEKALKRSNEMLVKKMAGTQAGTKINLWSSGNLRIGGKDTTLRATDAAILYGILKNDGRFENTAVHFFDVEKTDWKASYARTELQAGAREVAEV